MIDSLESRILFADAGGTVATALNLGALIGTRTVSDTLAPADIADCYRFALSGRGNFNATLTGLSADASLQLLNKSGGVIVTSARSGTAGEAISRNLPSGTYYLRVFSAKPSISTGYKLRLQADLNWGIISSGGQRKALGLVFADGKSRPINPNLDTWVVIHGWSSGPDSVSDLAHAIDGYSRRDQVLYLDWSSVADEPLLEAFFSAGDVGQWAAGKLESWGIPSNRINIVGHSMGGFVADTTASSVSGGVNRIIALDPATDPTGLTVDYADHSRYSLSFIGSTFSTPAAAATADESFRANVGPIDSIFSHMAVLDLFTNIVRANNSGHPDKVSAVFSFNKLSPDTPRPWKQNAYSGGYEGVLTASDDEPQSLAYKNPATGKTVTLKV